MAALYSHAALIRGINVGGNNVVRMAELRAHLDAAGLGPVATYIQSGNVLVCAPDWPADRVAATVNGVLESNFGVDTFVVAVSRETLLHAVADAPAGFGATPDLHREDVVFLRPGLSVADAVAAFEPRDGVDTVWAGRDVVYFRRVTAEAARSRLSKVMARPEYRDMTIRNWRTTTTLAALAGA